MSVEIITNEQGYSVEHTGNTTTLLIPAPPLNCRYIVKGMLINGQGNNGISTIQGSSGRKLLKLYHSNQSQVNPAGRTHIDLDEGESVSVVTTSRGVGDLTFFGVSAEVEKLR